MILFNDPLPQEDHTERAVRMALEMRERVYVLSERWSGRGHRLGFGIGMARGYATVGSVGFEPRLEYSVIGPVPNLACRLCDEAKPGQILISQPVFAALDDHVETVSRGELALKGFHHPVPAFELVGWRDMLDAPVPAQAAAGTH